MKKKAIVSTVLAALIVTTSVVVPTFAVSAIDEPTTVAVAKTSASDFTYEDSHHFDSRDNIDGSIQITGYNGSDKEVVIPSEIDGHTVTQIGTEAFSGCTEITSVTIPNSVTEINMYAFSGCTGLTSVTIPSSVKRIYVGVFNNCDNLTSINVDEKSEYFLSQDGVLFNKDKTELYIYPSGKTGSYIIPDDVTTIRGFAFGGCTGLTDVTLPNSLTEIGMSAFQECEGLTNVIISSDVLMRNLAFCDCTGLKSLTILNGKISMQNAVFSGCENLTTIYGYKGSWAEEFANSNEELEFISLSEKPSEESKEEPTEESSKQPSENNDNENNTNNDNNNSNTNNDNNGKGDSNDVPTTSDNTFAPIALLTAALSGVVAFFTIKRNKKAE